jgi:hypothetical protein|eukprot:5120694-Prymnesium_polylepis.4
MLPYRYNSKTKQHDKMRRLAVMEDNHKFDKLEVWAQLCLGLIKSDIEKPSKKLTYAYYSQNGTKCMLDSKSAWQGWLDSMWMQATLWGRVGSTSAVRQRHRVGVKKKCVGREEVCR